MRFLIPPFLALLALPVASPVGAQTTPGQANQNQQEQSQSQQEETPNRLPLWECTLPTGRFAVDLRTISSVSMHEYVVDGGFKVTEVAVVPLGSAIGRFYYAEPFEPSMPGGVGQSMLDSLQQKVREGAERLAGASATDALLYQVIKKYPEATHAHTIEYRLKSLEQAQKLYESVYNAWRQSRPAKLKVE